jgi:transcriptional regulator with XRE-family HTH domain
VPPSRNPVTKIELLRRVRAWSQRDLAEAADVSFEAVGRAERQVTDQPIGPRTARAIARALEADADELFREYPMRQAVEVDVEAATR